jgi:hypothetical protein
MDDSRFDAWTRAFAHGPSRRSLVGGSLGLAVAALTRAQAPVVAAGADPSSPWESDWCTLVDGTTHGWAEFEENSGIIKGAYANESGRGRIRNCLFFEDERRLDCTWIQTSDDTRGTFSITLNARLTQFRGTYRKRGGGGGPYEGVFQPSRNYERRDCL